jgi:hypothetical protein
VLPVSAQEVQDQVQRDDQRGGDMDRRKGDRDGMGRGHRGGKTHGGKHRVLIIDVNADGIINDDEAASLADMAFGRIDDDRNGAISEAEFTTLRDGPGRGWFRWFNSQADGAAEGLKAKFASLDADKNLSVSKVEFFVEAKQRLAAADTDKDGKVTPWEFRSLQ